VKQLHFAVWSFWLVSLVGCMARPDDVDEQHEELGVSESRLEELNGLNFNGLNYNGLNFNGLSAPSRGSLQDPGDLGELSRMVLRYMVNCALNSSQSFEFSWTDRDGVVHNELYQGNIGLAPEWSTAPLDDFGQEMVSACLASRVNRYGMQVIISMRSHHDPLRMHARDEELSAYPFSEGAFWGNLFSSTPYVRACYTDENVAYSRAAQRDCAAGRVGAEGRLEPCGIIEIVGSCGDICRKFSSSMQLYRDCIDPVYGRTDTVITTALP
jgi:hypothetical protein